ncbi:MAG: hypothetical protein HY392_00445 [Candidatus Diapherotrites archaeon]|nr:hypothetical protein [Candidatus Diapherotrites archaeon]
MELFRISDGPWEKIFDGVFENREMAIYSNDKSVLLVLIFEKEGKKTAGAVVELFKIFAATGEVEHFAESLPREMLFLMSQNEKETSKFLIIGSTPSYVEWEENKVIEEVDRLLKKIETSSGIVSEVCRGYDISLEGISSAKSRAKKAFFSTPLLVPVLSANYRGEPTTVGETRATFQDFVMGLTKEKNRIVEPISVFSKTFVTGGTKNDRQHALQLLAEGYLLSGAPVIIFDFDKSFLGLQKPNQDLELLKRYEIESSPIGFPVKVFLPPGEIHVDINKTDPFGLAQAMGFGGSKCVEIIADCLMKSKVKDLSEMSEKIRSTKEEKFSEFEVLRTARILLLLDKLYPAFFGGENPVEEISTRKVKSLGRGSVLDLSGLDERARLVLSHNILYSVHDFFSKKDKKTGISLFIIIPEAKNALNEKISEALSKDIEGMLSKFEFSGIGYALSNESELDFGEQMTKNPEAQINFIQGNDCAVQLKGRKSYRVLLRPTLSFLEQAQTQVPKK